MSVTAVLLHCCFSARKEFQISCYPYTRVSLGCQNVLIVISSSRRRCKLPFCVASISLLKGASQVKDLQDEVSYMLVLHFEESDISLWLGFLLSLLISVLSCYLMKLHLRMLWTTES